MKTIKFLLLLFTSVNFSSQTVDQTISDLTLATNKLENSEKISKALTNEYYEIKQENEKLKKRNDSIIRAIGNQNIQAQRILYKNNYDIISNNIQEIYNLERQLKEYEEAYKFALSGTIVANLVNPTSNALGTSFKETVISNSSKILAGDLSVSKKNKFENIMQMAISPIVSGLLVSNPIGSIVNNVVQQAVTYDKGVIKKDNIDLFIKSLQPHIIFYEGFNNEVDNYATTLLIYGNSIKTQQRKLNNYKLKLYNELGISDTSVIPQVKIDALFRKEMNDPDLILLRSVNNASFIPKTMQHIEKMPDFDIDKSPFIESHNDYITNIIKLLEESAKNTSLGLNSLEVSKIVKKLKETQIKN